METSLDSTVNQNIGLITEIDIVSKRRRIQILRLDVSLEVQFVYEIYLKTMVDGSTAMKKDNTPVLVELWLYWLNAGLGYSFSLEE